MVYSLFDKTVTLVFIKYYICNGVNAACDDSKLFCKTQWLHSMRKQDYITPPPPYFILWNAVTSLGENTII